jgi:hypothetical protein
MMEHFRVCGECREAFDFAATTITRTGATSSQALDGPTSAPRTPGRGSLPGSWPAPVKRNRRTILVFGAVVVAIVVAGLGKRGDAPKEPTEPPEAVIWRRDLSKGTPVVQSPAGTFESRPRVITALVPPGSGSFGVIVLDDVGHVVLQRDFKPGEKGCFLEEAPIDAPGGSFTAATLLVPFPEEDALVLGSGQNFGVIVTVSGGHASRASVFQVLAPGRELHRPPGEER